MSDDAIQTAASNADNMLRQAERDVMNERSFDLEKHTPKRTTAVVAIATLEAINADHPTLATLRQRFDEMVAKADTIMVDAFKQPIDGYQRAAQRDVDSLTSARENRVPSDLNPAHTAGKLTEWVTKIRGLLDGGRAQLSSEAGQKVVADLEAWMVATEQKATELLLLNDAFDLFRAKADVEGYGELAFTTALTSVEKNIEDDPERVVQAWDAVKKLLPSFQNPRFAEIPEIKKVLERQATLAGRVATELRPLLAKKRIAPLIRTATSPLDWLKRETDNLNEDSVLKARKQLREAMEPLERDWADQEDAQDFLRKCNKALRRSEEELGDKIVMKEIQEAEVLVKPLVERVERGLVMESASRVVEHAPRLKARLGMLTPYLSQQRAKLLHDRAEAALGRIETVLGAKVAKDVAAADVVPRFEIDLAADSKVQAVLKNLNKTLDTYREEHTKAQEGFEEGVDQVNGFAGHSEWSNIESAARTMVRFARAAEEVGEELAKLDRKHAVVEQLEDLIPVLVKRAQVWKDRLGKRIDYANAIGSARSSYENTNHLRERAASNEPHDAMHAWPEVLGHLKYVDEHVAKAIEIMADEHEEADAWGAKSVALRTEASEKLRAACLAEASRCAKDNDSYGAQRYADALREALPDAPENDQIAAAMAGTADARQQAQAEIAAGAAVICQRASASAQELRSAFDEWAEERKPLVALGGTIVQNLEQYQGKWVRGHSSHLGRLLYDDADTLNGDIYQFDYDPAVRDQLLAGMKRLDDLYAAMAEKVVAKFDVTGVSTTTQHYPSDAHYLCEIVGAASYTPKNEVRDNYGRVIGSVEGNPYPVPRVVIRGVATTFFVIVPGQPFSLDAMDVSGIGD